MTPPRRVEDPPPFRSAGWNHVLEALPSDTEGLTDVNGLTDAQVADRVRAGQVNDTPERPSRTVGQILAANRLTRFNAILGGLLVVVLVVGPFQDALFGVVLVTNAAIGIAGEWRAKRAGALLVISQVAHQQSAAEAVRGSVAGVGSMVPEGLVLLTSTAFATGAVRLGRRRVHLDLTVTAAPGDDQLVVTLADRGLGIPAFIGTRIFDPFVTATDSLVRNPPPPGSAWPS